MKKIVLFFICVMLLTSCVKEPLTQPGNTGGNTLSTPIQSIYNNVDVGSNIILTEATSGGEWSESDNSIAMVIPDGNNMTKVYGRSAGSVTITYTVGGLIATKNIIVNKPDLNPIQSIISSGVVSLQNSISLGNSAQLVVVSSLWEGEWKSSNNSAIIVNSNGYGYGGHCATIYAAGTGVTIISYSVGGATVSATITVN